MNSPAQILILILSIFVGLFALGDESEFRTFEQAPQIKEIADKYRAQKVEEDAPAIEVRGVASIPSVERNQPKAKEALSESKRLVREWYEKVKADPVAEFIRDNFYPELKGTEQMAFGNMIAPAKRQVIDMDSAAAGFAQLWKYRDALSEGGTLRAGQTAAILIRKFATRDDIFEVSKETDTTPYQDLKTDASKLAPGLAYRMSWAVNKFAEFRNPEGVRWTPTAYYQLGQENTNYIMGFMRIQFSEKPQPKAVRYAPPQSASLGQ